MYNVLTKGRSIKSMRALKKARVVDLEKMRGKLSS